MMNPQEMTQRVDQNRQQIQLVLQRRLMEKLAHELAVARRAPGAVIRERLKAKLADILSRGLVPVSFRRQMRFARSALRRHAGRSLWEAGLKPTVGSGFLHPSNAEYSRWIVQKEPDLASDSQEPATTARKTPHVSCVIALETGADSAALGRTLASLRAQHNAAWQACILLPEASSDAGSDLQSTGAQDSRIGICTGAETLPLAGSFVLMLQAGVCLSPHAIGWLQEAAQSTNPGPRLIYGDDDVQNTSGMRHSPRFKSAWNRDLLYSNNYIGPVAALDLALFQSLFQDLPAHTETLPRGLTHANLLAATAQLAEAEICHVPKILTHLSEDSQITPDATAPDEIETLINAHNDVKCGKVRVLPGASDGLFHTIWPLPNPAPKVCLIIPTRDQKRLTETAVTSILNLTDYDPFEILIVDNGSSEPDALKWLQDITSQEPRVRVLQYPHPFNYSAINNFAVEHTDADIIGLLNNDVEAIHADWLREMVSHALRLDIGCVGAKLHFTDSSIQHAGVALGIGPVAGHVFAKTPGFEPGYLHQLETVRNCSAVTGACLVMRRELYEKVGGLDAENLAVTCNDVDLCLKANKAGYRTIWTPHAALFHHESASRGQDIAPEKKARLEREQAYMVQKWDLKPGCDDFVNPHLFNWL